MRPYQRGAFISIEGGDGAGKSTVCERLRRELLRRGDKCIKVDKQPTFEDRFLADHVARLGALVWAGAGLEDRKAIGDDHWLYIAAAWYAVIDQHCVIPALAEHDFVLADSWYHKLLARFSLKEAAVGQEASNVFQRFTHPDLIFYLDVAPEQAARRKTSFGYAECGNFDGHAGTTRETFIAYQTRVRHAYRELMADGRWVAVKADNADEDAIVTTILDEIGRKIRPRHGDD
jgi:dTMP kinase